MLRRASWVLALLALLGALLVVWDVKSSFSPICQNKYQNAKQPQSSHGYEKYCSPFEGVASDAVISVVNWIGDSLHGKHDEIAAAATVVIAIFTMVLGGFTISLARSTRIAAEAANVSAKAATAIEFAILGVSHIGPELMSVNGMVRSNAPYVGVAVDKFPTRFSAISDVEFRNYGRTPAFLHKISMGFSVTKTLRKIPVYSRTIFCEPHTTIEEKHDHAIEIHFGFELSENQLAAIKDSTAVLWFYVLLEYRDVMRSREIGACWQWGQQNPEADGIFYFFDDGSAPATYTRKT